MSITKVSAIFFAVFAAAAFARPLPAHAGGEDFELFQADCTGFDTETATYERGARCVVDLLHGPCIPDASSAPGGFNAQVVRFDSRGGFKAVTPLTHYDACLPESENGKNRKMKFKADKTATYAVIVDGVGDGQPQFRGSVLAAKMSRDALKFTIKVRAK